MALLFWRKTQDTGEYRRDGKAQTADVAVSEDEPLPVRSMQNPDDDPQRVEIVADKSPTEYPIGSQTALTIDNTSGGILLTRPTGQAVTRAVLSVYSAPIRFWVDGRAPTTTTGHRAEAYDVLALESAEEVVNFRAIRESGVSATVEATYYGRKAGG